MAGRRVERFGGQIQQEISLILSRKIRDPRLELVTVTGVRMTADLKYASVYISVMGDEDAAEGVLECLENAAGFIRGELGRRLRSRYVPEIRFRLDESGAKGRHIDSILREIRESRDE